MPTTSLMSSTNGRTFIDRPPRIQPELPFGEYEIPAPPDKKENGIARLLQIGLPLISTVGFVLAATLGGASRSPLLVAPMALAVIASAVFAFYSYRKEKRRQVELEQTYTDRLIELHKEMNTYHDQQRRAFRYNYPDPEVSLRIVQTARIEVDSQQRTLRSEARLWERRVADEDFGVVRLGMGTLPSTVTYKLENSENLDDPQLREAKKLEDDSRYVSEIPIILSFRNQPAPDLEPDAEAENVSAQENYHPPVTHALGVVGERSAVHEFTRALLAHYVVFHAPMDARLYVLASRREPWRWTEPLPHSQGDKQNRFHCFLDSMGTNQVENQFDDGDGDELEQFLEGIRRVLAQRKIRLQEHEEHEERSDPTLPLILVVIDLLDAVYAEDSPLRKIEADAAISILLEEGMTLGAAVIFLVPERSKVPSGCRSVVEIEKTTAATNSRIEPGQKPHFRYAETGLNSTRLVGAADYIAAPGVMEDLAKQLAALSVRQGSGANLTTSVPFLALMGYRSLQELREHSLKKWEDSVQPQHANWLSVKLGLMSGNKARTLVLSAKRDGVHGMVAGSTGSGKSELLISLIMGLAVNYDPTVINFVLVDYKGGSAFNEFRKLPHCVDVVTNLGEDSVVRMFTTIRAELNRRVKLNTRTGTKDIVEYRRRGYHLQEPYPYLFIVIDEFAEMIADRTEFKAQLETITRLGRAQGVSLILAAQRPSGVTDQMRSNIKLRICLRVETPAESREMLRRSDAAFLPPAVPGRGYLQVANEEIELVQLAFTGERYRDPNQAPQASVIWPRRSGLVDAVSDQEPPELYKAIIDILAEVAKQRHVKKQLAPWPGFLPRQLSLSRVLISEEARLDGEPDARPVTFREYLDDAAIDQIMFGQVPERILSLNPWLNKWNTGQPGWMEQLDWTRYAMRPVIGLVDDPAAARQLPLTVDFPRGNVVILGASGWGKTTFLRTMIASLAATHSPDHFQAYILDLGGRNLSALAGLPHVGAIIIPDAEGYEERTEQVLRVIEGIIDERKTDLNKARLTDIYEYNQAHPEDVKPAILLVIDNFVEFLETFGAGSSEGETILDKLVALIRQGKPCAIHFAISVSRPGELPNQLYSLFTERFTLKLADPADYRTVLGEQVPEIPAIQGRGYTKIDSRPLSFQVATLAKAEQELKRVQEFVENISSFLATTPRAYKMPARVDALPKAVLFRELLSREYSQPIDARFLEHIKASTRKKWQDSIDPLKQKWLKATIGVISGDRPRALELEASKDGVHGLIAGATGSGKSELLMTLIVSLALNYDPSVLNLVLVDYKGGGTFRPFEKLPHCVDVITNLNKSAAGRVFTSIEAELQRRQRLNSETGSKDIIEYRTKGLHLSHEPYPHLFIIIDEYAEMITDSPEFREQLDSITSIGRSLGVNLFLASQRPVGVSDQMRANIKLRMALRVEGIDTSREMLRRPDAAFLPGGMPGRGYLQIGNENIELMQVAYTGEEYEYAEVPEGMQKPLFYEVIVALTQELLTGEKPSAPWPPILPHVLTFSGQLAPKYLDPQYRSLLTLDQMERLEVNPFVQDWLDGKGRWYKADWHKDGMRGIVGVLDDPYRALQLPLVVDFTKGHAVLFGASGWGKTTFVRSLIVSLASRYSPDEFQAHVLDLGGRNLEVLQELPHVGTVIMPDEQGYEERVRQLWRELNDIINERKTTFAEAGAATLAEYISVGGDKIAPAILIAIDNFSEYIDSFGDLAKQSDPDNLLEAFISLARQGKAYGLHFLISVNRLSALSSKLYSLFTERLTLRLADATEYSGIVGSQIDEIDEIAGRGYTRVKRAALAFQVALLPRVAGGVEQPAGEAAIVRAIGAAMHKSIAGQEHNYKKPLRVDALPTNSYYRQLLAVILKINNDEAFLDQLKAKMAENWQANAKTENADWLQATPAVTSGNQERTLHFEARKDGAHGMIAGGTGSGKSELLMTLIVALAVNYPPEILNFVLVDYKGGGAFRPFERLPHCVDIVTNLNKAGVDRMFTAINAEIRRRQNLNAETRTKDIIDYRRKGLDKIKPYPHLFIIIDEYAEMIDDNPEYKQTLESITRVGRAQGVNLILASQQPKGVSDQMRANIKLRLCLRVEGTETSREMLRRPDAAFLPNNLPGRGYLQVGNDNLELVQVAYTGEDQPDNRQKAVLWPQRPRRNTEAPGEDTPKLFDAVVALASELTGGMMAPKPWPNFLPENFSLESPLRDAKRNSIFRLESSVTDWLNADWAQLWPGVNWREGALRPVVGLVDDPVEAEAFPLRFDLTRNHLAVFGDAGLGKTTLLRSLLLSLIATHSPNELHTYVLDLGGQNFSSMKDFPHMGAIIYADEDAFEERLQRLLEFLEREIEARQQILSDAGIANLYEYNVRNPQRVLPAIVVLVDDIAKLHEDHEALLETTFIPLVRHSRGAGITFVVSGNVPSNMPSKLYSLLGERITFKQSSSDRYIDILGRGAIEIDDIPGRGYIRSGQRALQFQAARPSGIPDKEGRFNRPEAEELRQIATTMGDYLSSAGGQCAKPEPIRTLPLLVALKDELEKAAEPSSRIEAVLGEDNLLRPALIDLRRTGPHFSIVGPPLSGKTTALHSWILSLAARYSPQQVAFVLIDTLLGRLFDYGGEHNLGELPHVLTTITDIAQMVDLLPLLTREGEILATGGQSRVVFVVIDNFDDFNEEIERNRILATSLSSLARRYGRSGLHFVISGVLDGAISELRRRVQASAYGVGLRSAQAVDTLRVQRTPAALRDREFPPGRGYVVKSGQATMIQIASPYLGQELPGTEGDAEDEERRAVSALDRWVELLQAKYTGETAAWSTEESQRAQEQAAAQQDRLLLRMTNVVRSLQENNGHDPAFSEALKEFDTPSWENPATRTNLLRKLWMGAKVAQGLPQANAESLVNMFDEDEQLVTELEALVVVNSDKS